MELPRPEAGFGKIALMPRLPDAPRLASAAEAAVVAELLVPFNREYDAPTPDVGVLRARLERLLTSPNVIAVLDGSPLWAWRY